MALTLGELSGIISLNERPAMAALGKVQRGLKDTADEGQKSTDKLQAQTEKHAAAVEKSSARVQSASAAIAKARQREVDAVAAVAVAEARLAEARKTGTADSARVLSAAAAVEKAQGRVKAAQDATASSTRNYRLAQNQLTQSNRQLETSLSSLASTTSKDTRRISGDFSSMASKMSQDSSRGGRAVVRAFGLITVGLTGVLPAAGAVSAGLLAASGSALTLAGSVKQLAGVAALAPAGLFALGSGVGVLMSAFSGMGEALKTATEETGAAAGNAKLDAMALADAARAVAQAERTAADQRAAAARRVEDAQRSLADVVEDNADQQSSALRRVAYAERDVESSQRRVLETQRNLNDARKEAVDRLESLEDQLQNVNLSERRAEINLEEAQNDFKAGMQEGLSLDSLAMRKLILDVNEAGVNLEQTRERAKDLAEEHAQAAREGVKGNRQVVDAQQAVADAQQAQADAVQALGDAQKDVDKTALEGARRVADAQRDVADAVEDAAKAQVDTAESIADAHRNLEKVQVQQAEAAAKATEKSVEAMGKLTPSAQLAAAALLIAYGRLGDVRDMAQENFFTGFSDPLLELVDTVIPQLERGVGRLATAYGAGARTMLRALNRELGNGVLERMFDRSADAAYILNDAINPVVAALVTLTDVGMDYMPLLAGGIRDAAGEFNTFIQTAADDGLLRGWIDDGIQGTKDLFSILGSVVGILDKLEDAARAGGIATTLGSVADGLDRIEGAVSGPVFQSTMATIFAGARGGAEGLLAALGPIGEAFRVGGPALAEFLHLGGEIAGTFVGSMFAGLADPNFGSGLTSFLGDVQDGVEELGPLLPGLFASLGDVLSEVGPLVEAFGPTAVEVLTIFATGLAWILEFLSPLLTDLLESPVAVGAFVGIIGATATLSTIATFASKLGTITTAAKLMWVALTGPVGLITAAVVATAAVFTWFFTETEAGQKIVADGGWAMYRAWDTTSTLYDSIVKPRFTKASLALVAGFLGIQRDGGVALAGLQTDAHRTSLDVVSDFLSMKNGATRHMLDIVTGIQRGRKDLDTAFAGIKLGIDLVPGYFSAAKTALGLTWSGIVEEVKKPIRTAVDKGIGGLVEVFWKIPGLNEKNLPKPKLPPGFRDGGYTGNGGVNEAAGIVHGREYVVNAAATAAIGKENLEHMAHAATHGGAASNLTPMAGQPAFFGGNAAQIAQHGALYMSVASGMGPWNFGGAAKMWDGAAGVKVKVGRGSHQGYARPLERGGGILGYATGTNIDMSPSWMGQLSAANRTKTAAHELGHTLGLPHFTGVASIMNPYLGDQAATPTAFDIRALQQLYPGGSGKAGASTGIDENPFDGIVDRLIGEFQKAYPPGNMFADATGGIARHGMGEVVKWIADIKNDVGSIAGDIVGNIREFFGGGSMMTPTLMDGGGWLHDTDGPQIVDHRRKKPDAFTPYDEWQQMKKDYAARGGLTVNSTVQYVGENPEQFADRERRRMQDALDAYA